MIFVEPCAGMAAVSLRLILGHHSRIPMARKGSKQGYATTILRVMGLWPGQGAQEVHLNDPDEDVFRLWSTICQPGGADRIIQTIERWSVFEERDLWDYLANMKGDDPFMVARWLWRYKVAWPHGSDVFRGECRSLAPAAARHLGPTTVAKYRERYGVDDEGRVRSPEWTRENIIDRLKPLRRLGRLAIRVTDLDASEIALEDPANTVIYFDPPYLNREGYNQGLPRANVAALGQSWAAQGATVCISEGEGVLDWHHVDISDCRQERQHRSRSTSNVEWLSISREPFWTPESDLLPFFTAPKTCEHSG